MTTNTNTKKTLFGLMCIVLFMGALGWAAVPLYDWFCRVTGYGGTTSTIARSLSGQQPLAVTPNAKTMTIRFDASLDRGMQWQFKPTNTAVDVKVGETVLAFYEAYNPTNRIIAGTASYNVAPFTAGQHFVKIDCFCFQMQVLYPQQRVQMPVTFYVDPDIDQDPEARHINHITLSYTFYETDLPAEAAEAAEAAKQQYSLSAHPHPQQ